MKIKPNVKSVELETEHMHAFVIVCFAKGNMMFNYTLFYNVEKDNLLGKYVLERTLHV